MKVDVLIVAKTRMRRGYVCLGGLTMKKGQSVRLLDSDGSHPMEDVDLQVGHIYTMDLVKAKQVQPPHTEDVRFRSFQHAHEVEDLPSEILSRVTPASGGPETLFDGHLQARDTGTRFLDAAHTTPYSTQFWVPAIDLELKIYEKDEDRKYTYCAAGFKVPYVGCSEPKASIQAGALVRMSLSHSFGPGGSKEVCWLQLSHAY